MGASKSKATIEKLTEVIMNVSMRTVQDCVVNTSQDQQVTIKNTGFKLFGDYKIDQQTDVHSTCFANVQKQSQLQNSIADAIMNTSSSEGTALWPAFGNTESTAKTTLTNILKGYVNMDTIQKNYNNIKQRQNVYVENSGITIVDKIDIGQGAQVFAAATLEQVAKSGILNKIETHVEQQSSSKINNPFSFLGDMAIVFLVFIMFLLIIFIAYMTIGSRQS